MAEEHTFSLDPALTRIDETAFVASSAVVLGDVHVGPNASIWFGTVVRGDCERIRIGARSNVQDLSLLHADPGEPCVLGEDVTVGHRCIVHGARVEDGSLVGMGAIVMNGAVIGAGSLVGAGALVTEGKEFPGGSLILGSPARVVRELKPGELDKLRYAAEHYVAAGARYAELGHDLRGPR